jgi:hypothetical protein
VSSNAITFDGSGIDVTLSFSTGNEMTVRTADPGAFGPNIFCDHNSASQTTGDVVCEYAFNGNDDAAADQRYASWSVIVDDAAAASPDGRVAFSTVVANTMTQQMALKDGVSIGTASDSFAGSGNLSIDDSGEMRWYETEANGDNYVAFAAAGTVTSNQTCTFEDDANFIPDSCVGDGTDDDVPEVGDFGALVGGRGITNTGGTLTVDMLNGEFIADANGNELVVFTTTASAVNELTITNAATGSGPAIAATGGDADVPLNISSKGQRMLNFTSSPSGAFANAVQFNLGGAFEGPTVLYSSTNGGAEGGPIFMIDHDSSTPVGGDTIGMLVFRGEDSGGTDDPWYVEHLAILQDPTNGSEDGEYRLRTAVAGSSATQMALAAGVVIGAGSTFPGQGNVSLADAKGIFDSAANEHLIFQETASAVNYLELTNSATNNAPNLAANGSDSNIGLELAVKGAGAIGPVSEFDAEVYVGTGSQSSLTVRNDAGGSTGPGINMFHDSASPANDEFPGAFEMYGRDSSAAVQLYAAIWSRIRDVTNGSEDSEMIFYNVQAGATYARQMMVGNGVYVGNFTDGTDVMPGQNNLRVESAVSAHSGAPVSHLTLAAAHYIYGGM